MESKTITVRKAFEYLASINSISGQQGSGKLGYAVAKNRGVLEKVTEDYEKTVALSRDENELVNAKWPESKQKGLQFSEILSRVDAMPDDEKKKFDSIVKKIHDRGRLLDETEEVEIRMVAEAAVEPYPLAVVSALWWMVD
jgi:hypothetical protein